MEEELEPFAEHEYEPQEIDGRMTLQLHGEENKRKKIEADKVSKILEAIKSGWDIDIQYAVIDGDIDISELSHGGSFTVSGLVTISNSNIKGMVFFGAAIFGAQVNFTDTSFKEALFPGASFGVAIFVRATFEDAIFMETTFHTALFISASFKVANFTKARFEEANFIGARFDVAQFWKARFGEATFEEAHFKRQVSFREAHFKKPASFKEAVLDENTVLRGLWKDILRPLFWWSWPVIWFFTIGKVDLREASIITDVYRINTNIVIDTSTNPRLKRYIDDEQWIESWRKNPTGRWWREPVFWLWELTSHCGRSIGLWVFWSALFAVAFAFIYQAFGCDSITFSVDMAGKQPDLRAYLYYSVVTFTTLGFGDIIPKTNWARFAVGAEVVLGYVMLGGLISIFANKFARRS